MIKNKRTYRKFIAVFTLVGVVLMSALVVISTYKKYNPTIIFIGKESDYSIDFWKSFREGLYAAQDEFDGITLKIQQADGETDIDGQIKLMEEAIEVGTGYSKSNEQKNQGHSGRLLFEYGKLSASYRYR